MRFPWSALLGRGASPTTDRQQLVESIQSAGRVPAGARIAPWLLSQPSYPPGNYNSVVAQGYLKNELIHGGIRQIATLFSQAKLAVLDEADQIVPHHKMLRPIRRPRPRQTEYDLWEVSLTDLYLSGNCIWEFARNAFGEVIQIWRLEPDRIAILPNEKTVVGTYLYEVGGLWYPLRPDNVIHWKFHNPVDRYFGLSPILAGIRALAIDNEMTDFTKATLQNFAIPGLVIEAEQEVDPKSARELIREFEERYGKNRRGKPMVLEKGMKVKTVGMTMDELAFPTLRGISESRVLMTLGGAPLIYLLGTHEGMQRSIYNNYSEAREALADDVIGPLWGRFADAVTNFLLPEFTRGSAAGANYHAAFDTSQVVAFEARRLLRLEKATAAVAAGVLTRDEGRNFAGYQALAKGKPKAKDMLLIPVNLDRYTVEDDGSLETFSPAGEPLPDDHTPRIAADAAPPPPPGAAADQSDAAAAA